MARSPEHSLPIYVDFGEQNLLMPKTTIIKTGHANEVKFTAVVKPECSEEFDELTTLPDGLAVKVKSDGQVTVVDALSIFIYFTTDCKNLFIILAGEEVLYPTAEQDEWEAKVTFL